MENSIKIEFSHEQKGIITNCTFTECKYYFLDGFQAATIAGEQESFNQDIRKALNHIEKSDSTFHIMLDVCFNDSTVYRVIKDYTDNGKELFLMKFSPLHHQYISKVVSTKKDIIKILKSFYTEKLIEVSRAA